MSVSSNLSLARVVRALVLLFAIGAVTSCATQPVSDVSDPPGFLLGLFHGLTMLFSLVGSIFTDYRIYAFPNSGFWYDLGYLLGAGSAFGGAGAGSR